METETETVSLKWKNTGTKFIIYIHNNKSDFIENQLRPNCFRFRFNNCDLWFVTAMIHTEEVDSAPWESLTSSPKLVDAFPKNIDFH